MSYKEFRSEEKCSSCFCGCVEENGQAGCGMTKEQYEELVANETMDNLECKGLGISPEIVNMTECTQTHINPEANELKYRTYQEYKKDLDTELKKTAEGFVRIGYLLKVARDTNILEQSRYSNVVDFAKAEYGIDKTQVSRFIRINDKFSEGGCAPELKAEYRGFGYAKLSLMLSLPDSINEEITPDFSKAEIQAIKDEVDEEKKISDIEVMIEEKDEVQQSLDTLLQQVLYQMGKDYPKEFETLWEAVFTEGAPEEEAVNRLAPSGQAIYSVRIPGKGKLMLSINEDNDTVTIINVRDNEKEQHTKREVVEAYESICYGADMKESYQKMYGIPFPEQKKQEVAPVQQKSEPRKESKVKKPEPQKKQQVQQSQEEQPEEQLPGQTSIEEDFPEYMPDDVPEAVEEAMEEIEESEEKPENVDFTESEANSVRGYKAGITSALRRLNDAAEMEDWEEVKKLADDISWRAEQIRKEQTDEKEPA